MKYGRSVWVGVLAGWAMCGAAVGATNWRTWTWYNQGDTFTLSIDINTIDPELRFASAYAEVFVMGEKYATPGVVLMSMTHGKAPSPYFYGSLADNHNSFEPIDWTAIPSSSWTDFTAAGFVKALSQSSIYAEAAFGFVDFTGAANPTTSVGLPAHVPAVPGVAVLGGAMVVAGSRRRG